MGRLKSTVYARMEEMSFRSGAAVTGGVLAAAGVAVTLAVTLAVLLGGHSDAATGAPAPDAAARSVPLPSSAPAPSSAPPLSSVPASASPSATPRASRTTAPATAAGAYQPSSRVRAPSPSQRAAAPMPGRTTPWHPMRPPWSADDPRRPGQPGYWGWPSNQPEPWPWGLLRHRPRSRAGRRPR